MTEHFILQALLAQAWQLAILAAAVATGVRYLARNRPHLAHALWLVVLLKCVTPPVWHSPLGVFSWLSPDVNQAMPEAMAPAHGARNNAAPLSGAVDSAGELAGHAAAAGSANELATDSEAPTATDLVLTAIATITAGGSWWTRALIAAWGAGVVALAISVAIRLTLCWRRLLASEVEAHPELESLVAQLRTRLRIRRAVRLLVTDSRIGPAVIGLRRPTIMLPACVVRGRGADELEPILAHELIHIRRGDLWVGLLQTIAQALWWFHPFV